MNPQSTDTQPQLRLYSSGSKLAYVPAVVCSTAFIFVALVLLWIGHASDHVYSQGANALTIRAVLRANASEADAQKLAGRVRGKIPDVEVELIDEAMGRSLLSLQEPWIAQMPDFEVTPLPMLLEIRHPELLTRPLEVAKFVESLQAEPEVDFVAYNETAHDRLVKLAGGTAAIESHTLKWVLTALSIAGIFAQFGFYRLRDGRTFSASLVFALTTWAGGVFLGILGYRLWESGALSTGDWHRIALHSYITVGAASLGLILMATIGAYLVSKRR